ncbi:TetR family transcriptional regulator [Anaerovorax odorimutans]|uniref:TetR family transcriptional regulator n=1 Tax=Anaerovorax odorimutans TaxID=109327 RepID=UPI00040BFE48|nr:TetR family transcriptional regulator [Anaerovorax odorimutans]
MSEKNPKEISIQDKIIEAAIPLFAMKGFTGVSVRELAKAANVNLALISYYFNGKENLYKHILTTQFEIISNSLTIIRKEELLADEKMQLFTNNMIRLHKEYPHLLRLTLNEIINPTDSISEVVRGGIGNLQMFLRECIEEGKQNRKIRQDVNSSVAALSIISIINFYFLTLPLSKEKFIKEINSVEEYMNEALKNYFDGIRIKE